MLSDTYSLFLREENIGHRKVATIIADENLLDQDAEIEQVRNALKRWQSGQPALWVGDREKSERLTERLEWLLMSSIAVREVLDDRAKTAVRLELANSISNFIYGYGRGVDDENSAQDRVRSYNGIFQKCMLSMFFDAVHLNELGTYYCFSPIEETGIAIATQISITKPDDENGSLSIRSKQKGFLFAGADNCLTIFLVDYLCPKQREILRFLTRKPENVGFQPYKERLLYNDIICSDDGHEMTSLSRRRKSATALDFLRLVTDNNQLNLINKLAGDPWDIPL